MKRTPSLITYTVLLTCLLAPTLTFKAMAEDVQPASNAKSESEDLYEQLKIFGGVLERVQREYVDEPENRELIEAAMIGMLQSLDPHSAYMPPKNFEDMKVQTKGEFGGLGIEVTMERGLVKVVAPIADTPAERAGILTNDLIARLDGEDVLGLTLSEAVDIMRGKIGTKITLTVLREGEEDPLEIDIIRDIIEIKAVRYRAEGPEGQIAYIRLTTFNENTTKNLRKAMAELSASAGKEKFAGYILDLRNNPGGLLGEAVKVSDSFLSQGEIVSTRARKAEDNIRFNARRGDMSKGAPVLVLINGGSASASEIVAGALQDHHRALVVGTQSFGKGSVQTVIPLPNDGALRLTTARYFTPSGRSIQALGVTPDVIIDQELPEDIKARPRRSEASLRGHLSSSPENDKETPDAKTNKSEDAANDKSNIDTKDDSDDKSVESSEGNANVKAKDKTKEKGKSFAYVPRELEKDKQLQKAIEIMLAMDASKQRLLEN
ncbi:MAG: S41 family peptidase [Candidatus Micropelagos thuwalensis]